MKLPIRILLATTCFIAVFCSTALAASPQQIYNDAKDGSIDGKYSLSDLRAADAAITADQREYILWDEMLAAAIARIANPNLPKPPTLTIIRPIDSNGSGKIDKVEIKTAEIKTSEANKEKLDAYDKKLDKAKEAKTKGKKSGKDKKGSSKKSDTEKSSWPAVVLVVMVIAAACVAAWRVISSNKNKDTAEKPDKDSK